MSFFLHFNLGRPLADQTSFKQMIKKVTKKLLNRILNVIIDYRIDQSKNLNNEKIENGEAIS